MLRRPMMMVTLFSCTKVRSLILLNLSKAELRPSRTVPINRWQMQAAHQHLIRVPLQVMPWEAGSFPPAANRQPLTHNATKLQASTPTVCAVRQMSACPPAFSRTVKIPLSPSRNHMLLPSQNQVRSPKRDNLPSVEPPKILLHFQRSGVPERLNKCAPTTM